MKFSNSKANNPAKNIRVAQGTYQKALLKKLVSQLLIAIIGLFVVYLCFAATIVRFVPSSAGIVLTKNNTYPGSELPENAQVLISLGEEDVKTGLGDRLKQSFIPQDSAALVSVLAGPTGRVKWTGQQLTVNEEPVAVNFAEDPNVPFLEGQYIAICIKGDCAPGSPVIFEKGKVIGVPIQQNAVVPDPIPVETE